MKQYIVDGMIITVNKNGEVSLDGDLSAVESVAVNGKEIHSVGRFQKFFNRLKRIFK